MLFCQSFLLTLFFDLSYASNGFVCSMAEAKLCECDLINLVTDKQCRKISFVRFKNLNRNSVIEMISSFILS